MTSGCAIFPAAGPSGKDMVEEVRPSLAGAEPSYALVEIDQNTLNALARRAPPTLRGFFGDYRPAGN
jgi:polysaccharide export outer membrane protein